MIAFWEGDNVFPSRVKSATNSEMAASETPFFTLSAFGTSLLKTSTSGKKAQNVKGCYPTSRNIFFSTDMFFRRSLLWGQCLGFNGRNINGRKKVYFPNTHKVRLASTPQGSKGSNLQELHIPERIFNKV